MSRIPTPRKPALASVPGGLQTEAETPRRKRAGAPALAAQGGKHVLLIAVSFLAIFPLYWMIVTSLKPEAEVYSAAWFPSHPTLDNYKTAWSSIPMARMLSNSLVTAAAQTAAQVATSILAAYAFVRWRFRGSGLIYGLIALTWLVPFQVIMIPNYVAVSGFGWRDSLMGLIVPNAASAFAVMQLYGAFRSYPAALIEAARLDGCGDWAILWKTILPNLKAPIASIAILLFITSWNDYFWPLLVTTKMEHSTIQKGLQMFISSDGNMWGALMAGTTIASLPVLVIYLLLQRSIIDSFVKGGLK
ncbi:MULTISPECIES: carbohydrate ABC transporter permease [unclassified Paenibacillus]|uniref:carbohydrate ABC transporter permease n=1 Tax=unclassified Paenibacillus TaxID=185978 RepID=UPI000955ED59|nr:MULTISPECIES: carbohydrate ABC transporter permease [unclassified Paenibacillus]ASS66086.1 carbohydrate ABC transporter permease [Paenibacillus sp. RUD330]SIQ12992.1 multiple sugar transport system permease protein [Paenibacillus sp. RU4X]SIQ34748.1 multiple sugar transport system permease protein [Paenibacillus sp. RU4T]